MFGTVHGRKQSRWNVATRPMTQELTSTVRVSVVTTTIGIRTMAQSIISFMLV